MGGNENLESITFRSPTFGALSFDGAIDRIVLYIKESPRNSYKVIVGTDSASATPTTLVTAITVLRKGKGGIFFWTESAEKTYRTLRDRIVAEAVASIMLGQEVRSRLRDALGNEFFWDGNEIHADVGKNGPTKDIVDSIAGMIKGYDFEPVIKPYSFGAFAVADRFT